MKTKLLVPFFLTLGLFVACAETNPHSMDMTKTVQNAKTAADHEALAKHYDEMADEMQVKVDEHKKLLALYQSEPYLYPYEKQTPPMTLHCQNLINAYESAVKANREMAKMHRELATGVKP